MPRSLFALLIAELSLHELRTSVGMVADFLVGVVLLKRPGPDTLGVFLV